MRLREIKLPVHIRAGIVPRLRGFPKRVRMFAGDCETCEGEPLSIQLADAPDRCDLLWVDRKTILPAFLDWIRPRLLFKQCNVVFFHNLAFDLTALLYDHLDQFKGTAFTLDIEDTRWSVLAGKIHYAKVRFPCGTTLHIIDSFRFYTTALAKIGAALGCRAGKMEKPDGLGKTRYTADDAYFVEYAKNDALLGYEVGAAIIAMHREFDVAISISAPQFAMRVFTKHYMRAGERIALPNKMVCRAAILSYHGGKNGFYVRPGLYRNVTEVDISSAYPHAMRSLPNFVKGHFSRTMEYDPGKEGVYRIDGFVKKCRYAALLTHDGKAIHGPTEVRNLWVTSYELREALRAGEIILSKCRGWVWNPAAYDHNPLVEYVDEFYRRKESSPKESPQYLTYKLLLNSLYGKFIQNIEEDQEATHEFEMTEEGEKRVVPKTYKAGGLFSPVIATLITGFVRAYLHRLEHDFKAVHASTDSIKTREKIDPASLPKGLGGLNVVITGDCVLLRNKLYLHYDGPMNGVKPKKYALHGFWGSRDDLVRLVAERGREYTVEHLYRLKEAQRQGRIPLKAYIQKREVDIDWPSYIQVEGNEGAPAEDRIAETHETYWLPPGGGQEDRRGEPAAGKEQGGGRSVLGDGQRVR